MSDTTVGIYIATYNRAGHLTSDKVFPNARVVCPQSQADAYVEAGLHNGATMMPCPDKSDGNLCKKRNWILDNADTDWAIIVDDDYDYMGFYQDGREKKHDLDSVLQLIADGCTLADDLGTPMWGVQVQRGKLWYDETRPFSLLTPILGPFQALNPSRLGRIRYDEGMELKEDFDLSLRVLHKFHRTLRLNGHFYYVDHFGVEGGVVGQRRMDFERQQNEKLRARFGGEVVRLREDTVNPRIHVPIAGA